MTPPPGELIDIATYAITMARMNWNVMKITRKCVRKLVTIVSCACRKSNPDILVMQPAQDRTAKNVTDGSNGARYRRILI